MITCMLRYQQSLSNLLPVNMPEHMITFFFRGASSAAINALPKKTAVTTSIFHITCEALSLAVTFSSSTYTAQHFSHILHVMCAISPLFKDSCRSGQNQSKISPE